MRACNSPSSRAFSIAMTAWSAKVRTSSICRSVNGSTRFRRKHDNADRLAVAQQRHPKHGTSSSRRSSRGTRNPGRQRGPRHARPCLPAPSARQRCRDRGEPCAGARSPKTRAPLHWPNATQVGRPRPRVYRVPLKSAPQSRTAVSTTVSSTGCTSAVERLMTLSTSLVAVWYSSNSRRSPVRCCNSR